MFKGVSIKNFNATFQSEEDCRQYLYDLKWKSGFICRHCGNNTAWKGRTRFHKRCIKCGYDESCTAHSIFHKIQFPLIKAFIMTFQISVLKKGMSTIELASSVDVEQKTAWRFKRKLQDAMGDWITSHRGKLTESRGSAIDAITITHRRKAENGLQRVEVEVKKYKKTGSLAEIISCYGKFLYLDKADPCDLFKGRYRSKSKDIRIWNFKVWLTGIHHHCSGRYLHGYLNEFCFRYNNRSRRDIAWHTIMKSIIVKSSLGKAKRGKET